MIATTHSAESDLARLLANMTPARQPGRYVFATLAGDTSIEQLDGCVCWIREPEGLSVVVPDDRIPDGADVFDFLAAWITLRVYSSLSTVGLTAAVASALGEAGISCNMMAGARHDHLFVPEERIDEALDCLHALQAGNAHFRDSLSA